MKDRLLSLLGICKKAGKLTQGFDAVSESAGKGEASLILTAKDLSPKSGKEVEFTAAKTNTEVVRIPVTIDEIWRQTGKRAGVLAVLDKGLAQSVKNAVIRVNEEDSII